MVWMALCVTSSVYKSYMATLVHLENLVSGIKSIKCFK